MGWCEFLQLFAALIMQVRALINFAKENSVRAEEVQWSVTDEADDAQDVGMMRRRTAIIMMLKMMMGIAVRVVE